MYFGLDDSQRSLNGNCKILNQIGMNHGVLTVHLLYSNSYDGTDQNIHYIWSLEAPSVYDGPSIREFLLNYCKDDDFVLACKHYRIYPDLKDLEFLNFDKKSRELRYLHHLLSKADKEARSASAKIYEILIKGRISEIRNYQQFYFGDSSILDEILSLDEI